MEQVVVRFAPSPTGYLHIGGARTALLNWLYAKKHNGRFLLRIEDTDANRNDQRCIDAILESLKWLCIDYHGSPTIQSQNLNRHAKVAHDLLATGKAYRCYCSTERLDELRKEQSDRKLPSRYDRRCRGIDHPLDLPYVIRLKVPDGMDSLTIDDTIKGRVTIKADDLDDLIMLRSDGTPTYLLSVVVDDHDAGITNIIRGDDHFTNTFRQALIYQASGWKLPKFAHLPLIHGADGAKLSKRHGAVGVQEYRALGYLPQAIILYLFSLGFGDRCRTLPEMIARFDLQKISKSASRIDLQILNAINARTMKNDPTILDQILVHPNANDLPNEILLKALPELIPRSQTIVELIDLFRKIYLMEYPQELPTIDPAIREFLRELAKEFTPQLFSDPESMKQFIVSRCGDHPLSAVLDGLRWLITHQPSSPNIYRIMAAIGPDRCIQRMA